jgi:hypothetical protein
MYNEKVKLKINDESSETIHDEIDIGVNEKRSDED